MLYGIRVELLHSPVYTTQLCTHHKYSGSVKGKKATMQNSLQNMYGK